ncbi:MAG: hypothetical protein AABX32_05340 [Nanoarchaeota archaeon]
MLLETPKPIRGDTLTNTINRVLNYELGRDYDLVSAGIVGVDTTPLLAIAKGQDIKYLVAFYGSQQGGMPRDCMKFGIFGDKITPEIIEKVKQELSGQH